MQYFHHWAWYSTVGSLALTLMFTGCVTGDKDSHPIHNTEIPYGTVPQPTGTYSCQWQTAQAAQAGMDHQVIYESEWYMGGKELGPFGQRHFAELAEFLKQSPCKIVIVPHFNRERNAMDNELNQARMNFIVGQLAVCGVPNPSERVILAESPAEGLHGERAATIGAQYLQGGAGGVGIGTATGGPFGGTGTTATGTGGIGTSGL